MKKILLTLILGIFLLSFVTSASIDYQRGENGNPDLKVDFNNRFLGIDFLWKTSDIGTAELKSHKSTDEVLKVGAGNQVTMYYDFNFNELQRGGLGEVYFTDQRTNELVERDYKFVYWGEAERDIFETQCQTNGFTKNGTIIQECNQVKIGTEKYNTWLDYNSKDIPKGKIRIGLMVEVLPNDYIDGVWTIVGKEVVKHASWTADLNTDIVSYYKLDETTGAIKDELNLNNGTSNSMTRGATGIINFGISNDGTANREASLPITNLLPWATNTFTISLWAKFDTLSQNNALFSATDYVGSSGMLFAYDNTAGSMNFYKIGGISTLQYSYTEDTDWHHWIALANNTGMYIYLDGSEVASNTNTNNVANPSTRGAIGSYPQEVSTSIWNLQGTIDEVGIWNRSLTQAEVTQLYNGGAGISYTNTFGGEISVSLLSPTDAEQFTTQDIDFSINVTAGEGIEVSNVTLNVTYPNGTEAYTTTNTSGISGVYNFSNTFLDGTYNWTAYAFGNDSERYNATETRDFFIDSVVPTIDIISPNGTYDYLKQGETLYLSGFANDTNLDSVWFEYNGTNTTISGATTETLFNQSFLQADSSKTNITIYANDSIGNEASQEISWGYKVYENSRTFNISSYETAYEGYSINVTANSSLTAVTLNYGGTSFATTQSGNVWSYNMDIPTSKVGNNTINWLFTYGGSSFSSSNSYQNVLNTIWTRCNATYSNDFLNISFKDEATLENINATIPTSTFTYYLGTGTVTKSYTYVNTTESLYFDFCASPDRTFNVQPYVQYKQGTDYPQRIWDGDLDVYNSTLTEKVLYLLSSLDGIYVTFQVIDSLEQGISGVNVLGNRTIESENTYVADGTTGAGGGVTFWLNPDFVHTFVFSKTGYETYTIDLTPTQSIYTITLAGTTTTNPDYTEGIDYLINPSGNFILKNTEYNFNYVISAEESNLDGYGFSLYADDILVTTQTGSNPDGETLDYDYNVSDASLIIMNYYYLINSTYLNGTAIWDTYVQNDYSISYFFDDLGSKIDNNVFGIEGDDGGAFAKAFLSLIILLLAAGILSSRYGLQSEQAVSGIIFGVLLLLNSLNFLPSFSNFPVSGNTFHSGTVAVFITATWLIFSIFREESR